MISQTFINRMNKELFDLESDPPPHIVCYPCEDDMTHLVAYFHGPPGTAYESGLFQLDVTVPLTYPFNPPMIRFVTPIYHPNIDDSGRICASILKKGKDDQWKPSMNLRTTLISLHALMGAPNPDDPLDADIAREYQQDYDLFIKKAVEHTKKHAVDMPEKVIPVSSMASDSNAHRSKNVEHQNGSIAKSLNNHTIAGVTSSTIIPTESTPSNTIINDKPKRKSKLSLTRKKDTGSLPKASSQYSTDDITQTGTIEHEKDKSPHMNDEAAPVCNDMKNRISDDNCGSEQQTNGNQNGRPNDNHSSGSNDKSVEMEQQTLSDQTNESKSKNNVMEQRIDDKHEDEPNDKSDEKQYHEQDNDDEKQQNDETTSVEQQIRDDTDGQLNTSRHNDVVPLKNPSTGGQNDKYDYAERICSPLEEIIDNTKISKITNIENSSPSLLLPIENASVSPPLPSLIGGIHTTAEPSTALYSCFSNDNDVLADLSSTLNNEPETAPKRKRNKISLSCKKKPKTA